MLSHMINPDQIHEGDEITIQHHGSTLQATGKVASRASGLLIVDMPDGGVQAVRFGGRRNKFQIVAHQPRLV
jgi:hypothetical protein